MSTKSNIKIRYLVFTALFSAISVVLMYLEISIPIVPSFIKFDFSDLPALICSFAFGPLYGVLVCLLKNLHWPGDQLCGNLRKNVSAPAFLPCLGRTVYRIFLPDLKRWTFHHHPVFCAGADAHLSSGHCPDPAGSVRKTF